MTTKILVADIGGTHARFAFATAKGEIEAPHVFRAADFPTIGDAAEAFLKGAAKPERACFAVAAPVGGAIIDFTNSPWTFDIEGLRRRLGLRDFLVVNDFAALAASVRRLAPADFVRVKDGAADKTAPIVVIGPGSGLGQALIIPCEGRDRIVPTQGGHVGFAPSSDEEIAVLKVLARKHGRVSLERLLSGQGLENIHRALSGASGNPLRADEITSGGSDPFAAKATAMFCAILGSAAGDAALATGAFGGVVLGGGILPKIRKTLLKSAFAERFCAKGRMSALLGAVPVDLIVREHAALLGAAALAEEQAHISR